MLTRVGSLISKDLNDEQFTWTYGLCKATKLSKKAYPYLT